MSSDPRLDELRAWLQELDGTLRVATMRPASSDASFRRYLRIDRTGGGSVIAMDAPPALEDCRPFMRAADIFGRVVRVPRILAADPQQGFLLLEDFGSQTYLDRLGGADAEQPDALYTAAGEALIRIQAGGVPGSFPPYDRALLERELALFPTWFLERHRAITLSPAERQMLDHSFELLVQAALAQPVVHVHRDYHSRNLMAIDGGPGIIDFQDAVEGPLTYDLVSLFRDAYIDWPEERELDWVVRWWEAARRAQLPVATDFGEFWRSYEWMGVQRQLKVLGIFARLAHRDGKPAYLGDMPRVLGYLHRTLGRYDAFAGLARLMARIDGQEQHVGYTF